MSHAMQSAFELLVKRQVAKLQVVCKRDGRKEFQILRMRKVEAIQKVVVSIGVFHPYIHIKN